MSRILALLALSATIALTGPTHAADGSGLDAASEKKLYDLGYPADPVIAVKRWRADTNRIGTGPLAADETSALQAHALPEFYGAMAGNPFLGMGLALRHKTRPEAEREAAQLCRQQGGGSACGVPVVIRADHCVFIAGYDITLDRRPTYRTSVAVSADIKLSRDRAIEACQTGASHPERCRPLVSFCGDGRAYESFDKGEAATASR